jgi:hypothetical protein
VLDFAKEAGSYVVYEAANRECFRNPRMGAKFLQLVADVFFDVLESVKEGGGNGGSAGAILDSGTEILLAGVHQTAIGVVNDHDFLSAEKKVGDNEGAKGIFGDDSAGIADDVGVPGFEAKGANGEAGVHAGEHGELALGARGEFAELVSARIELVGNENFVDDGHGGDSLTQGKLNLAMGSGMIRDSYPGETM